MADSYSTYVAWAKTLLPLGALGLLSTVFLFARAPGMLEGDIPYADIEELAREQKINAPALSGVSDSGAIISVTAESARPDDPSGEVLTVERIRATIDSPGESLTELRAGGGRLDNGARMAWLNGLTRIVTSDGFEIETAGVMADLQTGRIETDGALEARAPFGELTAGRLVIDTPEGASDQRLVFNEGVRLVYRAKQ